MSQCNKSVIRTRLRGYLRLGPRLGLTFCASLPVCLSALADNGRGFTIVATEETVKDMSVNLVADTLRDDRIGEDGEYIPVRFAERDIYPPTMAITKEEAIDLVNHDSGILDIQHTLLRNPTAASRILIHFETLKDELEKNCWTAQDAPKLRAKLRLFVIPPYGPGKQNRWYGVSPTTHFVPQVGLDPPPARVPIAVFEQQKPWSEGNGQNSFFTATYDDAHLLDVTTVGVSKSGTSWEGLPMEDVDLCLNRQPGVMAIGDNGNKAELCYDADPNWSPWMEWDVTAAVQKWLTNGFDPATTHGFSLYQYPGVMTDDQIRFAPEEPGKARTRAVVSFASSSGKADCPGVGGLFGGPSQAEIIFGNAKCQTSDPNDLEPRVLKPGDKPTPIPRILEMKTHPEWAPQLVIEAEGPARTCSGKIQYLPERPDVSTQGAAELKIAFGPLRSEDAIKVQSVAVRASPGLTVQVLDNGCKQGSVVPGGKTCIERLAVAGSTPGEGKVAVKVDYLLNGETAPVRTVIKQQAVTISQDFDGTADAIEDMAPNNGDANQDQVPDRAQSHVNSVQDPRGGWLSVATRRGLLIEKLEFPDLVVDTKQRAVQFNRGFIGFTVKGVPKGESAVVQISSANAFEEFDSFWGYGPTPKDFNLHWFPYKNHGSYGSKVVDGKLEMILYDGALGDTDGIANGEIVVRCGAALAVGAAKKMPRITDATVASSGGFLWLLLGGAGLSSLMWGRRQRRD